MKKPLKLFDLTELERSEKDAIDNTCKNLGGIIEQYELIFDTFLKLSYFFGQIESVDTPLGSYQSYFQGVYCELPYTLRIAYDLFLKAYYLEVEIIVRHLFEVLIAMRYFQSHPERLTPHLLSRTSKRDRVSFKTMFEEISPGFYDNFYGTLLSGAAHGNLAAERFRIERSKGRVVMGCEFNSDFAGAAVNQIMVSMDTIFPAVRGHDLSRMFGE